MIPYNKKNSQNARNLRKSMTSEERQIWYHFLKKLPCTVRRQHCIEDYIVDFYIAEKKTVIEIDGSQHNRAIDHQKDKERELTLLKLGITVLRVKNDDVNYNFDGVVSYILNQLNMRRDELQ